MHKSDSIFLCGHRGMVGSAIHEKLISDGYKNIIIADKKELDLANQLNVGQEEVISMNRRMVGGDVSLNATINTDGDSHEEWQSLLRDYNEDHAEDFARQDEINDRRKILINALKVLNEREKSILLDRRLREQPLTLEQLSEKHKVSRERVRQIESRAIEKLQNQVSIIH